MMQIDALTEEISRLLEAQDIHSLKKLITESEEMQILHVLHQLSLDDQLIVFRLLAKDMALEVFEELDTDQQQNLLNSFTSERINEYMNEIPPDDRVKLLDELPAVVAKGVLSSLDTEERQSTNV